MFFSLTRRIFDLGLRAERGIPQARPSWETTPTDYPIKSLPWGAYMDASDNATIEDDGAAGVLTWRSATTHPTTKVTAGAAPFRFFLKEGGFKPQIGGGTANPSGTQHISFTAASLQYFKSGVQPVAAERWDYGTYSDTAGGGGDEGLWTSVSTTHSLEQTTPANVPDNNTAPRFVAANSDKLDSASAINTIISATSGLLTFAFYGDAAAAPNFGTSTAQTPYDNPALLSDSSGYIGVHFTTSGITAGFYDGVNRDVGGGPNDGWQMVTVPLATATFAVVQVRWGNGSDELELRVHTAAGWGTWNTCAFSSIAIDTGLIRLGANYSNVHFLDGVIYTFSADPTYLSDTYADEEARHIAFKAGIDIFKDNGIQDDAFALFGPPDAGGLTPGYVAFTVARANSRTTSAVGATSKWFWGTSTTYIGLASIDDGGAQWDTFAFDDSGAVDYDLNQAVADDTWALVTSRLEAGVLKARKDGDNTTDISTAFAAANPNSNTSTQHLVMGYSAGGAVYSDQAIAFFGACPTRGWTETRIRDVERFLNGTYMTAPPAVGDSYDPIGTFGFFGM